MLSRVGCGSSSGDEASSAPAPPDSPRSAGAAPPRTPSETPSASARKTGNGSASSAAPTTAASAAAANASTPMPMETHRLRKFEALLAAEVVDLRALRTAAWSGIPSPCRAITWQLLLGYLPPNRATRESTLEADLVMAMTRDIPELVSQSYLQMMREEIVQQ